MLHAFDLFDRATDKADVSDPRIVGGLVAVIGSDRYLTSLTVSSLIERLVPEDDREFATTTVDGTSAQWKDVSDFLETDSLFVTGRQLVVVKDADSFVTRCRSRLENLAEETSDDVASSNILVVCVTKWAANTRLYKLCEKNGLNISAASPLSQGKKKSRDNKRIVQWIVDRAATTHGLNVSTTAARQLLDLVDDNYGRIDNDLAKLALLVDSKKAITADQIIEIVGGWKTQTVWQAVDHAADGNLKEALELIHRLLLAGENPLGLFSQLAWSLRRYGLTYDIFMRAKRRGENMLIQQALKEAGFRAWGGEIEDAQRRLKRIGRAKIRQLQQWLLQTDMALKDSHSRDNRARHALEKLLMRIASPS